MVKSIISLLMNKKSRLKNRPFILKNHGYSMLPLLYSGDIVSYVPIKYAQIKTNDLVLVNQKTIQFTHRVIYKRKNYLITKGDNNIETDGKIYRHQILGKAITINRNYRSFDLESVYLTQSSIYLKEFFNIVNRLVQANVPYVCLKGLPIHLYYENTAPYRLYYDIDLLIDRLNFNKVKQIFLNLNYHQFINKTSVIQLKIQKKIVETSFYKKIGNFHVIFDVHLEPAFITLQNYQIDRLYQSKLINQLTHQMLINTKKVVINNRIVLILSIEYQLLYLCLHFFHHGFTGIYRLEQINKITKKCSNQQILRFVTMCYQYQIDRFIFPCLYLLKKYFQTNILNRFSINKKSFVWLLIDLDKLNVFVEHPRANTSIKRFIYLFLLSPQPICQKLLVFIDKNILLLVALAIYAQFKLLLNMIKNRIRMKIDYISYAKIKKSR